MRPFAHHEDFQVIYFFDGCALSRRPGVARTENTHVILGLQNDIRNVLYGGLQRGHFVDFAVFGGSDIRQLRTPEVSEVTVTSRNFRQLRTTSDTCHPTPQVSEVTVTSRNFRQLRTPATLPHKCLKLQ
ncbi:hypothetical protein Bbelb_365480 [Branchiostoma belcheri]|nr:hypothetical protein Bbelb_365480 [Branchiostoma belcheri]